MQEIPKIIQTTLTLKQYFLEELPKYQIVFERVYPGTIPSSQRKSLFCTELYNVKKLLKFNTETEHSETQDYASELECRNLQDTELNTYYKLDNSEDQTLIFESRFESGNLRLAVKKSDSEYDLYLQNDINTRGHTQWFFFRVTNTRKNSRKTFNLCNFVLTVPVMLKY